MRKVVMASAVVLMLAGCSAVPHPLVPDTPEGPASYVCYNSALSSPDEVRTIAERQCNRWGLSVRGLIGQTFTPMRCGILTPTVAAFGCGHGGPF